ncbi:MAG: hypothetical protein WAV05_10250 [Anaerolineales bacterium]
MKKYLVWICFTLAITGGLFAGWVDFNNDEPQAAVLVILALIFPLGLLLPRKAWLWALIVGLCLPGIYLLAPGLGYQPVSPPSPGWYASILALIPAFMGAYAGALTRLIVNVLFVKS